MISRAAELPAAATLSFALWWVLWLTAPSPAVLAAAHERGGGVSWFDGTLEQALGAAREQNKLVLVECWASWCHSCHELDREVWSRADLARSLQREVVPIKAEVDRRLGRGTELAERFDVDGLPLVLLLDPDSGDELGRIEGMFAAETVLAAVDEAARSLTLPDPSLTNDPDELLRAGERARRARQWQLAAGAFERVLALDADCSSGQADDGALLLAGVLAERDEMAEAIEILTTAAERCPDTADAVREIWQSRERLVAVLEGERARGRV
ncbi:MAG: thioredoxin family protein, partial [Acidobacteriota bacterium]